MPTKCIQGDWFQFSEAVAQMKKTKQNNHHLLQNLSLQLSTEAELLKPANLWKASNKTQHFLDFVDND